MDTEQNNNKLSIEEFLRRDEEKDLLRFLTAGSVDDGKSTLIGRLLFDSKKIYEDQLDALERDSKRMGNAGDHMARRPTLPSSSSTHARESSRRRVATPTWSRCSASSMSYWR